MLPAPQVTYLSQAERQTSAEVRRSSKDPTTPVATRIGYLGSVPISIGTAAAVPNAINMLLSKLETLHKRAGQSPPHLPVSLSMPKRRDNGR